MQGFKDHLKAAILGVVLAVVFSLVFYTGEFLAWTLGIL